LVDGRSRVVTESTAQDTDGDEQELQVDEMAGEVGGTPEKHGQGSIVH